MSFRRTIVTSNTPALQLARRGYRAILRVHVPVPKLTRRPLLLLFRAGRSIYYNTYRLLVCEPLFRAACKEYGRNLTTGVYVHFVSGDGDIIVGDDCTIGGKCSFQFASRFAARPTLRIGSRVNMPHNVSFSVATNVTIGDDVMIGIGTQFFNSPGHPLDAARRVAGEPPDADQVREIVVGNRVWIGVDSLIMPGVRIGDDAVIAARSIVTRDVLPNTLVAGAPARVVRHLASEAVRTAFRDTEPYTLDRVTGIEDLALVVE